MATVARYLLIMGKVQGVFYRNWTVQTCQALRLTGWVRNRMDGNVEAVVEGPADSVMQFIALAHEGPSAAHVLRIDVEDIPVAGLASFEKKATC